VTSEVLVPEKRSFGTQFGLKLELDSISQDLFWISNTLLVDDPTLIGSVVAAIPNGVHVVDVFVSIDIEALTTVVSEVPSFTCPVAELLVVVVLEDSDHTCGEESELLASLD
jgi:hypothetical protein